MTLDAMPVLSKVHQLRGDLVNDVLSAADSVANESMSPAAMTKLRLAIDAVKAHDANTRVLYEWLDKKAKEPA